MTQERITGVAMYRASIHRRWRFASVPSPTTARARDQPPAVHTHTRTHTHTNNIEWIPGPVDVKGK